MFGFLKKKKASPVRDVEQLIFDIAEYKRDEDFHLLYELMIGREVFIGIDPASLPGSLQPGIPYTTQVADQLKMKFITIPDHGDWSSAATSASHSALVAGYAGMQWFAFLEMTLNVPQLQGAVLQGQSSWIAFDKERIRYILSKVRA
jgi:hypothetical protein